MAVTVLGANIGGASAANYLGDTPGVEDVTVYERGRLVGETTDMSAAFSGFYGTPIEGEMKQYGIVGPTALDGLFVVGLHSSGIQLSPAA